MGNILMYSYGMINELKELNPCREFNMNLAKCTYTLYGVKCTLYIVQCTVYNVYIVQCILCTVYNVRCTVYIIFCVHCTTCRVYSVIHYP